MLSAGSLTVLPTVRFSSATTVSFTAAANNQQDAFVGRAEYLTQLDNAFSRTQLGKLNVVFLNGPSGIGKTALVKHFLSSLTARQPEALALKGRCYEFESVPYKGLDSLVDELARYLQHLPDSRVEALLPRDAFLLPKLLPVLGRVPAIESARARELLQDAQEVRQQTFRSLRELLARLSDRIPLVIWIDDVNGTIVTAAPSSQSYALRRCNRDCCCCSVIGMRT